MLGDREPDRAVGSGAGCAGGGGDGDVRVGEDPAGLGLASGAGEGEEDPVGVPGGLGQAGVAVELCGEAVEAFGAVVVLDKEREVGAAFGPDAVAVGADDLAPLPGAASLGPPLGEGAAGPGAGGAEQGGEEAVGADEVGEALAGGEVVGEGAPPGEVGEIGPRFRRRRGRRRAARGPSGTGAGLPQAWGRKRSTMSRAYSSDRRIRARRSPVKPTSATCAVVSTRWSSRRRQR